MALLSEITFVLSFNNAVLLIRKALEPIEIVVENVTPLIDARAFSVSCSII